MGRGGKRRPRVVIAGGGVAGLETLLALRALLDDRVDVMIVAPEVRFVNRSMAVDHPARPRRVRGLKLQDVASDLGVHWHRGAVDRVEAERHLIVTDRGSEVPFDRLVLAVGARPAREWQTPGVLTYHDGRDSAEYRLLLRQLHAGRIRSVAFVRPGGPSWPLPLYDLALATADHCDAHGVDPVFSLITPEPEPLAIFGTQASDAIRQLLDARGVTIYTSSYGVPSRPGRLHISPGDRRVHVDRIVTLPRLIGPMVPGIPAGRDGFIPTDLHGRVQGLEFVFAAGDATMFPIKQGGLAAQQADAAAEAIARSLGADVDPQPFRPVLRGLLLTGDSARYLRADITIGGDSTVSEDALWWPPNRLCGRYLAPYLSSQVGFAADVMRHDEPMPVAVDFDAVGVGRHGGFAELTDLAPG